MIKTIQSRLKKVEPSQMYTPKQVHDFALVLGNDFLPAKDKLYRILRTGKLPAHNITEGEHPKYLVKGSDLITYVKKTWKLN